MSRIVTNPSIDVSNGKFPDPQTQSGAAVYSRYSLKVGIFAYGRKLFQQAFEVEDARFQFEFLFRFSVF